MSMRKKTVAQTTVFHRRIQKIEYRILYILYSGYLYIT